MERWDIWGVSSSCRDSRYRPQVEAWIEVGSKLPEPAYEGRSEADIRRNTCRSLTQAQDWVEEAMLDEPRSGTSSFGSWTNFRPF